MSGPKVLLTTLSIRTSAKGTVYLSGWLGKASVVGFAGEPDKYGNNTWNIYAQEPEARGDAPVGASSRPVSRPRPRPADSGDDFDDIDALARIGR
jgi:hypothetical protein